MALMQRTLEVWKGEKGSCGLKALGDFLEEVEVR
jgi:hypothetical protein